MKIQQHDGVVVDAAMIAAGLCRASARGRGVAGEREAPRLQGAAALPPPLYIGPPWGCAGPRRWDLLGGGAAKGVPCPPRQVEAPPPQGFPTLGAGGPKGGAHQRTRGWFPSHFSPWGPPGWVDTRDPSGGPGTIPVTPETFPMAETRLPIYNSLPPDHSGTPRDVRGLILDSEQLSVCCILISLQP